jgi:hypothetical protein
MLNLDCDLGPTAVAYRRLIEALRAALGEGMQQRRPLRSPSRQQHKVIERPVPSDDDLMRAADDLPTCLSLLRPCDETTAEFLSRTAASLGEGAAEVAEIRDAWFREVVAEQTPSLRSEFLQTPSLRSEFLHPPTLVPSFAHALRAFPRLRRLTIGGFGKLPSVTAALAAVPLLEEISVACAASDEAQVAAFVSTLARHTPRLRALSLRPSGHLWEPINIDTRLAAAPALLPHLEELDVGGVRDAGLVISALVRHRDFCQRALRVVVRAQPMNAHQDRVAGGRAATHEPFGPAARLLLAAPRLRVLGVGMDSVANVFSAGNVEEMAREAEFHPAIERLLARVDVGSADTNALEPLRRRRIRSIADTIDADAWDRVLLDLAKRPSAGDASGRGERGPSASEGGPSAGGASAGGASGRGASAGGASAGGASGRGASVGGARAFSPIARIPWHFASIRTRIGGFVGKRSEEIQARGETSPIFHYHVGYQLWDEEARAVSERV